MSKIFSQAPARICLFGDHQDYLNLPVIACAIDRYIEINAEKNEIETLHVTMHDLRTEEIIPIHSGFENVDQGDFLRIALRVLARYGCKPNCGYSVHVRGNVPINAGLSSSTAFTIAWIQFLIKAFGISGEVTPQRVAQLAYEVEVLERGSSGGKMDQFTIAVGGMIYLETGTNEITSLDQQCEVMIIGDSGVSKDTFGTLAKLKSGAIKSIQQIQDKYPDFDIPSANPLEMDKYMKCIDEENKDIFWAAVHNYNFTRLAFAILKESKRMHEQKYFQSIGKFMTAHHEMLRDKLKITVPLIDDMIDAALQAGAYGAKIVGSGGGGCIVALAPKEVEAKVIESILAAGARDAFKVNQSLGSIVQES